eukprot:COSAG03_NODE_6631_length_1027_cov_2.851293_1_plen_45_part_00
MEIKETLAHSAVIERGRIYDFDPCMETREVVTVVVARDGIELHG